MDALEFIPAPELAALIREGAHAARDLRNEIDAKREAARVAAEKERNA